MKLIRLIIPMVLVTSLTACLAATPSLDEARKTLDADIAAIRQSGQPATVDDLPKPPPADATNALTNLRAVFKALDVESEAYTAYSQATLVHPLDATQIRILQQLASENRPAVDQIAKARTKHFTWDTAMASPLNNVKLPDLGQQRQVANVLFACALAAHTQGDDAAACDRLDDMLYIARCADEQSILISHLVAIAIINKAADAVTYIAPDMQFAQGGAARKRSEQVIHRLLDESASNEGLRKALCMERVFLLDTILAFADGRIPPAEVRKNLESAAGRNRPLALPDDEVLKTLALTDAHLMLEHLAKMIAAANADWPTAKASLPDPPNAANHPWAATAEPVHERIFTNHFKSLALRRLAATALALRSYALDHQDKLPETLSDLVPVYLPAIPTNPFVPTTTLHYDADQPLLSSPGPKGVNSNTTDASLTFRFR